MLFHEITPRDLAEKIIYDPTCGAGDLLLQVASRLPLAETLEKTLSAWGERLAGTDIHDSFVQTTRLRLALLAFQRGAKTTAKTRLAIASFFPMIRAANALSSNPLYGTADLIITNPPFSLRHTPKHCKWASGAVTAAALFIDQAIKSAKPGASVHAILPDVLRSGSRYHHWRSFVSAQCALLAITPFGQFKPSVDVDVFITHLRKGDLDAPRAEWCPKVVAGEHTVLSQYFRISVGPLVPYRDKQTGPLRAYLHAQSLPRWERLNEICDRRRYSGRVTMPPFVVIRRTSRPGDAHRAVAIVVTGRKPIAVENHLIVCKPKIARLRNACT